ncbi:unnamed protein product, partial [Ectocarpus sp. 13 AM-2016]
EGGRCTWLLPVPTSVVGTHHLACPVCVIKSQGSKIPQRIAPHLINRRGFSPSIRWWLRNQIEPDDRFTHATKHKINARVSSPLPKVPVFAMVSLQHMCVRVPLLLCSLACF